MLCKIHNIIATDGIKNKLQPTPPRQRRRHNQQFSQPLTLQSPVPALLIPAENHQRLEWPAPEVIEAKTIDTFVSRASRQQ